MGEVLDRSMARALVEAGYMLVSRYIFSGICWFPATLSFSGTNRPLRGRRSGSGQKRSAPGALAIEIIITTRQRKFQPARSRAGYARLLVFLFSYLHADRIGGVKKISLISQVRRHGARMALHSIRVSNGRRALLSCPGMDTFG
jgi:hypothetical protein